MLSKRSSTKGCKGSREIESPSWSFGICIRFPSTLRLKWEKTTHITSQKTSIFIWMNIITNFVSTPCSNETESICPWSILIAFGVSSKSTFAISCRTLKWFSSFLRVSLNQSYSTMYKSHSIHMLNIQIDTILIGLTTLNCPCLKQSFTRFGWVQISIHCTYVHTHEWQKVK